MQIVVYGLWHLGCVTAACLAQAGHRVFGLDADAAVVAELQHGQPPLYEPGLADVTAAGQATGLLSFTTNAREALADAELVWVTFDTPVDDHDEADVEHVRRQLEAIRDDLVPGTMLLISSQVPVGFTRSLELAWQGRGIRFGYSPENLRLGKAIEVFRNQERIVAGVRTPEDRDLLFPLFDSFTRRIEWMSVESAEMTKHALNAFLATSVTFANELARLCEVLGADAREVERGLKSESRIGPRAYLAPGAAFAGGTLARDLRYLLAYGDRHAIATPLCRGVLASNDVHKGWVRHKLLQLLGPVAHPVAAVLGLTYKPGTSTLRRSSAIEHCLWLGDQGVRVQAHDPAVTELPEDLRAKIVLCDRPQQALAGADVAVVATEWPEYRQLDAQHFRRAMRQVQVIDPTHFLADVLAGESDVVYLATGRTAA